MSFTLELLRMETEREFWQPGFNGLLSSDCPNAKAKKVVSNNNNNNNDSNHPNRHHRRHGGERTCAGKVRSGLSSHKRHSYYDCCVNVDVSELLEHWLGWDQPDDKPATSPMPKSWADRLVSHLIGDQTLPTDDYNTNSEDPSIWVRKFCSEVGCDVLKKQDSSNGKTLLHHLLSGTVKRNLATTARILIESGTPVNLMDGSGDLPLHLVRNFINPEDDLEETRQLVLVLVDEHGADQVNQVDAKGRSLLTYTVEAGDRCQDLTRLLINLGAKMTPSDSTLNEADTSALAWYLRAQMRKPQSKNDDGLDEETLYLLCTAMMEEDGGSGLKLKAAVDRLMIALGTSRQVHGPLFRRLRGLMASYWLKPSQLRQMAVKSIRRSLGPKRLSKGQEVVSRLKVPHKLQRFITLEEKIPAEKK